MKQYKAIKKNEVTLYVQMHKEVHDIATEKSN